MDKKTIKVAGGVVHDSMGDIPEDATEIMGYELVGKNKVMDKTTDLNEINTSTKEGRLLMSALAVITTECRTSKTPYEVLDELYEHGKGLYQDDQLQHQEVKPENVTSTIKFLQVDEMVDVNLWYQRAILTAEIEIIVLRFRQNGGMEVFFKETKTP